MGFVGHAIMLAVLLTAQAFPPRRPRASAAAQSPQKAAAVKREEVAEQQQQVPQADATQKANWVAGSATGPKATSNSAKEL